MLPISEIFIEAVKKGDIKKVRTMLDGGVDPNIKCKDFEGPALNHASYRGYYEIAKLLIDYGADINEGDKKGINPLMFAVDEGHVDIVELLLDSGVDIYRKAAAGINASQIAAAKNRVDILMLLKNYKLEHPKR